jgi:hypothetical protein
MRGAKFENNINAAGWETLEQRTLISRICALFKTYTRRWAREVIEDRLLKPCYLCRDDHDRKIRTTSQRTDVGQYFLVNCTTKCWNQLAEGLLASLLYKLNAFRKRVKNVVTSKGIKRVLNVNK